MGLKLEGAGLLDPSRFIIEIQRQTAVGDQGVGRTARRRRVAGEQTELDGPLAEDSLNPLEPKRDLILVASQRRETFSQQFPNAVGHYAAHLDIYHADNPNYVNLRNTIIDGIKATGDIAQEIKDVLGQLQK